CVNQVVSELPTVTVTYCASNAALPAQIFTFSLVDALPIFNLTPATGVLTWTPTEAQGPGTYAISVKVSDNGTPSLSATQTFNVNVSGANTAPAVTQFADQPANGLATLTATHSALDADTPAH